jgi:hypothetical protein
MKKRLDTDNLFWTQWDLLSDAIQNILVAQPSKMTERAKNLENRYWLFKETLIDLGCKKKEQ